MKMEKKTEAIDLRKSGLSINRIAKQLGVSQGSVSLWVKDVCLTQEQKDTLLSNRNFIDFAAGAKAVKEKHMKQRLLWQEHGKEMAKKNDYGHVALCMLYWAEGSKCKNSVTFCNSDINMIKYFLSLLKKYFIIEDKDIIIRIKTHIDNGLSVDEIQKYWIENLELPETCLRKCCVDNRQQRSTHRKNILYYGVCSLTICKTEIVQHIFGAIQEYAKFKNETWIG